jgi:hypothetical protein
LDDWEHKSVNSFKRLSWEESTAGVPCSHSSTQGSVFLGSSAQALKGSCTIVSGALATLESCR